MVRHYPMPHQYAQGYWHPAYMPYPYYAPPPHHQQVPHQQVPHQQVPPPPPPPQLPRRPSSPPRLPKIKSPVTQSPQRSDVENRRPQFGKAFKELPRQEPQMREMTPVTMSFRQILGAAATIQTPVPTAVLQERSNTNSALKSLLKQRLPPRVSLPTVPTPVVQQQHQTPLVGGPKPDAPKVKTQVEVLDLSSSSSKQETTAAAVPTPNVETNTETTCSETTTTTNNNNNPFEEIFSSPGLERQVILQMVIHRRHTPSDSESSKLTGLANLPKSNVISDGFYWRELPELEQVLHAHLKDYFLKVQANVRDYKAHQEFNNFLVTEIEMAAKKAGLVFDPNLSLKKLRDRIRTFYKTHLQNAKKRLATLAKHPNSKENQALVCIYLRCAKDPNLSLEESFRQAGPRLERQFAKLNTANYRPSL